MAPVYPAGAIGPQYDGDQLGGPPGADYRAAGGMPVINVAGCPTHPGWVLETLLTLATDAFAADDLDIFGRPRFYPKPWCIMVVRATSSTSSRPAPRRPPTWAA